MNPMIRRPGETQKNYRERLRAEKSGTKFRGRLLWDSYNQGTYIRRIHGELK